MVFLFPAFALLLVNCALAADAVPFVDAKAHDFSLRLDILYATKENFTKHQVYPMARCFLRKPVAEALSRVQSSLKLRGLALKVFDCYRPLSVQKEFWKLVPDERYVANPEKGSRHNRGAAVDVTLVDRHGEPVPMPSGYDDFSEKAHRDWKGATAEQKRNRETLEKVMTAEGFQPFETEWWHFDYKGWESYPLEDVSFSDLARKK